MCTLPFPCALSTHPRCVEAVRGRRNAVFSANFCCFHAMQHGLSRLGSACGARVVQCYSEVFYFWSPRATIFSTTEIIMAPRYNVEELSILTCGNVSLALFVWLETKLARECLCMLTKKQKEDWRARVYLLHVCAL